MSLPTRSNNTRCRCDSRAAAKSLVPALRNSHWRLDPRVGRGLATSAYRAPFFAPLDEEVPGKFVLRLDTKKQRRSRVKELIPHVKVFQALETPRPWDCSKPRIPAEAQCSINRFDLPWIERFGRPILDGPLFNEEVYTVSMYHYDNIYRGPCFYGPSGWMNDQARHQAQSCAEPGSVLIEYTCDEDLSPIIISHILAAGLVKAKVLTMEKVEDISFSLPWLEGAVKAEPSFKGKQIILVIHELQRMLPRVTKDVVLSVPGGRVPRALALSADVHYAIHQWPRAIISGDLEHHEARFMAIEVATMTVKPFGMLKVRYRRASGFRKTLVPPFPVDYEWDVEKIADLEREYQFSLRALEDPSLERDPISKLPLAGSSTNHAWIRKQVFDLCDLADKPRLRERNWERAIAYLRRFFTSSVDDEILLLHLALLRTRRNRKLLREMQATKPASFLEWVAPVDEVRAVWLFIASHIIAEQIAAKKLSPSQTCFDKSDLEEWEYTTVEIPELVKAIPEAAEVVSDVALLNRFWNERMWWQATESDLQFQDFADMRLVRIGVSMDLQNCGLATLIHRRGFVDCDDRYAVAVLVEAARQRVEEPRVRRLLERIGLVRGDDAGATPWEEVADGRRLVRTRTIGRPWKPRLPSRAEIGCEEASKSSLKDDLWREARDTASRRLREVDTRATQNATPRAAEASDSVEPSSLLHRLAVTKGDARTRTVHEAFDLGPDAARHPVFIKCDGFSPWSDWVLVKPDESISILRAGAILSEQEEVISLTAAAIVLRAWLGNRGVAHWATVPIKRVHWKLRKWEGETPVGPIAEVARVTFLDAVTMAPIWSDEAVQVLCHMKEDAFWGVEGERERAGVKMPSAGELVERLKQAGMEALQKIRARRKATGEGN